MSSEWVGSYEAADIRKIVERVLRDLGAPEPPLKLDQVRAVLELNLGYYSSVNTSLIQEVANRIRMAGKQIISRPMLLVEAVKKANFSALWVPDFKRILIDESIPKPRQRCIEGHEIGHSLIPWHREFLFGDDEYTLDPVCHAIVEAEANYASSQLLFLQDRFRLEALDEKCDFGSVKKLAARFGNTITTTLWRAVEDRDPEKPIFGMVTAHPHYPSIGRGKNGELVRHFVRSHAFRQQFPQITSEQVYGLIRASSTRRRAGPIGDATHQLTNLNGERCEFRIESFCNNHAVLTYGVMAKILPTMIAGM